MFERFGVLTDVLVLLCSTVNVSDWLFHEFYCHKNEGDGASFREEDLKRFTSVLGLLRSVVHWTELSASTYEKRWLHTLFEYVVVSTLQHRSFGLSEELAEM